MGTEFSSISPEAEQYGATSAGHFDFPLFIGVTLLFPMPRCAHVHGGGVVSSPSICAPPLDNANRL